MTMRMTGDRQYPGWAGSLAPVFVAVGLWLAPMPGMAAGQSATPCRDKAAPGPETRLTVDATGAHSAAGNITFTLYGDNPALFLKPHGALLVTRTMLAGPGAAACFAVSGPGIYAVAIYHDENNNHHFDRNFLGLPAEGYGFSNDAPTLFGPPAFDAARVTLKAGDNRIQVRLRY